MVESPHRALNASDDAHPAQLEAGRVGRAHGLDGSFYITGARPRLLAEGGEVTVAGSVRSCFSTALTTALPRRLCAGSR
jgi:hypothetical protein